MTIEQLTIKIQRLQKHLPLLPLPTFHTQGSSGCDLLADIEMPIVLKPMERRMVPTGVAISVPEGFEAQVRPRSGLAMKYGLGLVNAPGTIDSDYRGEIKVILINLGEQAVTLKRGDRIAQLVLQKIYHSNWQEVSVLDDTERGDRGFGHTGVSVL